MKRFLVLILLILSFQGLAIGAEKSVQELILDDVKEIKEDFKVLNKLVYGDMGAMKQQIKTLEDNAANSRKFYNTIIGALVIAVITGFASQFIQWRRNGNGR